jgi:hypothetical protein
MAASGTSCQEGRALLHQSGHKSRQNAMISLPLIIRISMKNARNNDVADRRAASTEAKAALLNAYRAAKTALEPSRLARQAERAAIATAREERRLQRERTKLEEQQRIETDALERQAAIEAVAVAEIEARESAEKARIARVIEDETMRKAERDRRYANRKARQA